MRLAKIISSGGPARAAAARHASDSSMRRECLYPWMSIRPPALESPVLMLKDMSGQCGAFLRTTQWHRAMLHRNTSAEGAEVPEMEAFTQAGANLHKNDTENDG